TALYTLSLHAALPISMDRAWRTRTPDGSWTICVQLPRALLSPAVRNLDDVAMDAIHPDRPESRLLFDYVAAVAGRQVSSSLAERSEEHTSELQSRENL